VDFGRSARSKDNGAKENSGVENCQKVEENGRRDAAEGVQHRALARFPFLNLYQHLQDLACYVRSDFGARSKLIVFASFLVFESAHRFFNAALFNAALGPGRWRGPAFT
jgi:hypothetical protein